MPSFQAEAVDPFPFVNVDAPTKNAQRASSTACCGLPDIEAEGSHKLVSLPAGTAPKGLM